MSKNILSVLTAVFVSFFPFSVSTTEKNLIFNPPGSFLGTNGTGQLDYVTGVLDALFFVEKNGPLTSRIADCLFEDQNISRTQAVLHITAKEAAREVLDRGQENFSVVEALIERLKIECPK